MKKLIFTIAVLMAAAVPAFAANKETYEYDNTNVLQATDEILIYRPGSDEYLNWTPEWAFFDAEGNMSGMASITVPNTGLHILDTDMDFDMILAPGSDYTADRTVTLTGPDANLTLTLPTASGTLLSSNVKISQDSTVTAGGTTGAQTINKPTGTVNFAAGASSLVVTNSLVTTSSLVFAEVRTNDTTALIKSVVPASGSFTIRLNAAATAETSVGFWVVN